MHIKYANNYANTTKIFKLKNSFQSFYRSDFKTQTLNEVVYLIIQNIQLAY